MTAAIVYLVILSTYRNTLTVEPMPSMAACEAIRTAAVEMFRSANSFTASREQQYARCVAVP